MRTLPASAGLLASSAALGAWGCHPADGPTAPDALVLPGRAKLPVPTALRPTGISLQARAGTASAGEALSYPAWMFGASLPGPTLRLSSGDPFRVVLANALAQETVVHWHGLDVPAAADGHPRLAIPPGATYTVEFTVRNRAGTYWYHPHPHTRTGEQTYRGLAGFLLVDDAEEGGLGLPSGDREVPLLIQDKRVDGSGRPVYQPSGLDLMVGYLGDAPFVNGAPFPYLEVRPALHRLRILNGSNARIYDLALSDGQPLVLVGNDGGLLDAPERLSSILLAPAERVDVLVDFAGHARGDRIVLRSRAFEIQGGMGMMGAGGTQGRAMDLMEFVVGGERTGSSGIPSRLSALPPVPGTAAVRRRTFRFTSQMMGGHVINGQAFSMDRVDLRVPLGETEVWTFANTGDMPHPVHMHAGQFRVLSRSGGRGRVFPWERGLKDTVLLLPSESVDVAVRFEAHRGLYLLHCHNLEHEDAGMMLNFEVV